MIYPGYGIKMLAGRNFSFANKADDTTAFILNEAAVKDFRWTLENCHRQKGKPGRDALAR